MVNRFWNIDRNTSLPIHKQLFCFPFAGGSSTVFRQWKQFLKPNTALYPVELPGKGRRLNEQPYTCVKKLVADLSSIIGEEVCGEFALFGHSLGAIIAYELAKNLEKEGIIPNLLVVSGCRSPSSFSKGPAHSNTNLSDEEIIAMMDRLQGTSQEYLMNQEFLNTFMPILRADFKMYRNYVPSEIEPLKCTILALGGDEDPEVCIEEIYAWKEHSEKVEVEILQGNHFFLHNQTERLIERMMIYWNSLR